MNAEETTTRPDIANATIEFEANRETAPLPLALVEVDVLVASSVTSEGVAPSVKEAPQVLLRVPEAPLMRLPNCDDLARLIACLTQSEQVTFLGMLALPEMMLGMI